MLAKIEVIPFNNHKERISLTKKLYNSRAKNDKYTKIEVNEGYIYIESYQQTNNIY